MSLAVYPSVSDLWHSSVGRLLRGLAKSVNHRPMEMSTPGEVVRATSTIHEQQSSTPAARTGGATHALSGLGPSAAALRGRLVQSCYHACAAIALLLAWGEPPPVMQAVRWSYRRAQALSLGALAPWEGCPFS